MQMVALDEEIGCGVTKKPANSTSLRIFRPTSLPGTKSSFGWKLAFHQWKNLNTVRHSSMAPCGFLRLAAPG